MPKILHILFVALLIGVSFINGQDNEHKRTFSWGKRVWNDISWDSQSFQIKGRFLRVTTEDFNYEDPNRRLISYISVTDDSTDGNGGEAVLLEGGPGKSFVKLRMSTKRNHGFNYTIQIYGS